MGLFDNAFGSEKGSKELTKSEAFAGILLGACASDGHIADEEDRGLRTIMGRMRMYDNWSDDKFNSTINKLLGMIKRQGVGRVMRRCADALPTSLHATAFANACDLVLADGVVEDEEKEFLDDLQRILDISGDDALTIVEVLIIKNKGVMIMGLFDDAFSGMESKTTFSKAEAFAGIMLSAVACDGHISDEEEHGVSTVARRMKLFEHIDHQKWKRMLDRLLGILKRDGVEGLLDRSVAALPDNLHDTAFAVACNLVLADQGIEDEEKQFLSTLQKKLELDRELALKIFKVMVIKNRG